MVPFSSEEKLYELHSFYGLGPIMGDLNASSFRLARDREICSQPSRVMLRNLVITMSILSTGGTSKLRSLFNNLSLGNVLFVPINLALLPNLDGDGDDNLLGKKKCQSVNAVEMTLSTRLYWPMCCVHLQGFELGRSREHDNFT